MPDTTPLLSALERWRGIEQAASSGPWTTTAKHGRDIADEGWSEMKIIAADRSEVAAVFLSHLLENDLAEEDEAFITTARTAMPCLLAAIDAVLRLADRRDAAVADFRAHAGPAANAIVGAAVQEREGLARQVREAISRELLGEEPPA